MRFLELIIELRKRKPQKRNLTSSNFFCVLQENLFYLLCDTEKIDVMETFDKMDTNQG